MRDIKALAEACASWQGRAGNWLQIDLDNAVDMMNTREVKRAGNWGTPAQRYAGRTPISPLERALFQATCRLCQMALARAMRREAVRQGLEVNSRMLLITAARLGTTRALVKGGYLVIEEGRLSQPKKASSCVINIAG